MNFSFGRRGRLGRIGDPSPGLVRVECRHGGCDARDVRPQIVDAALVADEKRMTRDLASFQVRRRLSEPIWPSRFCH